MSDFNRETVNAYGIQHDEWNGMRGMAKRSVFVIASDGSIRYKWVTDDPTVAPNVQDVLDILSELELAESRQQKTGQQD